MKEFNKLIEEALTKIKYLDKDEYGQYFYHASRYDYEDRMDADQVVELLNSDNWREAYEDILMEIESYYEYDFVLDRIVDEVASLLSEEEFKEIEADLIDHLSETIFDYVYIKAPDYLGDEIAVQISVGTYEDANHDYTLNGSYDWSDEIWINFLKDDKDSDESTLVWLIKQQGYTKQDFIDILEGTQAAGVAEFFHSILQEILNVSSHMNALTFLGRMSIGELLEVNEGTKTLVIPKEANTGLYDGWAGGGSMFDIQLEKDVEVPKNMVKMAIPAYTSGRETGIYSVQEVYGFIRKVFDTRLYTK